MQVPIPPPPPAKGHAMPAIPPDAAVFAREVARVTMQISTQVQHAPPQVATMALQGLFVVMAKRQLKIAKDDFMKMMEALYDMTPTEDAAPKK